HRLFGVIRQALPKKQLSGGWSDVPYDTEAGRSTGDFGYFVIGRYRRAKKPLEEIRPGWDFRRPPSLLNRLREREDQPLPRSGERHIQETPFFCIDFLHFTVKNMGGQALRGLMQDL